MSVLKQPNTIDNLSILWKSASQHNLAYSTSNKSKCGVRSCTDVMFGISEHSFYRTERSELTLTSVETMKQELRGRQGERLEWQHCKQMKLKQHDREHFYVDVINAEYKDLTLKI